MRTHSTRVLLVAVMAAASTLTVNAAQAAACKSLEQKACSEAASCTWVSSYERSDGRRYYLPCPQCGHEQILRFFPKRKEPFAGGLFIASREPVRTYYVCEANGCVIEDHEKDEMLRGGRWIAERPGEGRHPGFHINALYSPFEAWNDIAGRFDGIPQISTNEAETELLVNDGDTIIIGGIMKNTQSFSDTTFPGLAKIPGLGWLFKNEIKNTENKEMLIFITPRIVQLEQRAM